MKIQGTKIRGLKLYSSAVAVEPDSYFNLVSLLLPGNGTNGAQNNTFLDSSSNALTVTRNGNTTQGTFSPFNQAGWSNYFDGSGDFLSLTGSSATNFNGVDWTVECWFYKTALSGGNDNLIQSTTGTNNWIPYLGLGLNNNLTIGAFINAAAYNSSQTYSLNTWNHLAMVRSSGVVKVYLNGTATSISVTSDIVSSNLNFWFGKLDNSPGGGGLLYYFNGYLSNLRFVKGTAVYTANFTPPTASLTAITNTSLLTCQSNRFIDNSTNAFSLGISGNTSVQAFAPFDPTAAYSAETVGGSAYLDGSGDYLTISNPASLLTFGTGDFTVECFVYPTAGSSSAYVCWIYGNSIDIVAISVNSNTGAVTFTLRGTNLSQTTVVGSTGLVRLNEWTHLALVRTGTNFYGYVNGTRFSTTIAANAAFNEAQAQFFTQPQIGASSNPVGNYFTGYVSGWRALKGTALYTAATITVPSAPLTAIANTSALLNSTNGGITDAAAKNVLETVDNAQISTAQSKWGGSSMYFDGTGDYLSMVETAILNFGSGDFTIEAWIYATATVGANRPIWSTGTNNTNWMSLFLHTTAGRPEFFIGSGGSTIVDIWPADVISTNTWYHLAVTRSGSTFRMFLNGTVIGSGTSATAVPDYTDNYRVGYGRWNGDAGIYAGYINDLRITKGYARYTANFTPPTAAFPTQ